MRFTPNENATRRTKDRIRQHGPDFSLLDDKQHLPIMGGPALCLRSERTGWLGWLRTDELEGQ